MSLLQQAAQAMIDRWDSPLWKDQPHTADCINELRKALDAELHVPEVGFGNIVEPEAWTWDTAGTGWTMTGCVEAHFAFNKPHPDKCILNLRPLYLHPPQQVAVPNMFWNHDDADKLYSSISEFLNDEICNGQELAVGDIRTVQRAVRLPNIDIRITSVDEDECDAQYEIVEAQGEKP